MQVNHQRFQFVNWLQQHKFNNKIPIYFVVIVNENSKIEPRNNEDSIADKVIRDTKLLDIVISLHNNHNKAFFTKKELQRLQNLLIDSHILSDPEILTLLNLNSEDLLTGVICPECTQLPMKRVHGKWICLVCKATSKNAHLQALHDYALLINPTITNKELRKYLHIDSEAVVNYILKAMNFDFTGNTKGRVYNLTSGT